MTAPLLSVVIPTLDEEERLPALLADVAELEVSHEVLVVDGGSTDGTLGAAWAGGARVVDSARGRSVQLRTGASEARGAWLFFVHADTRLPAPARQALQAHLSEPASEGVAAYFRFALEGRGWFWRFIELGQRIRERVGGLVYGDQGLVVSATAYNAAGGYPDWALMEDVGFVDALRHRGAIRRLDAELPTSPRRYAAEGRWRAWLRNVSLIARFRLGASPERIAHRYPPLKTSRHSTDDPRRTLLVFAKAPRPGSVKTRLAADLGERAATRIYRQLGRLVVDAVRGRSYRTVVCHAPADAGAEMVDWLGPEGVAYRPQSDGDLGQRMAEAFTHALEASDEVCIVGTDAPGVDGPLVDTAFEALSSGADLVVGPAEDGGYYLLGLKRPCPTLFHDMPWSGPDVLALTLERAGVAGLSLHRLSVLRDVDTVEDVPQHLLPH